MLGFQGTVSGGQLQSIYQLGTAVALAFIVAGPEVRKILAKQLSDLKSLRATLWTLSSNGFAGAHSRIELCDMLQDTLDRGEIDTIRANSHTNIWYVVLALISFAFLLACSIFQTIPAAWAWFGIVVVFCVLFTDPIRVAIIAPKISKLVCLVDHIAKTQDPRDPQGLKVIQAKGVIAQLKLGQVKLKDAITQLDNL